MTIKTDNLQIGNNPTATQNFVLKQGADGTCTLARGNVGATTQDILNVANTTGLVTLTQGIANAGLPNLTIYTTQTTPLPAAGTAYTASHSLGAVPTEVVIEFICLTAEGNYSIGDVCQFGTINDGTGQHFPVTYWKNTTQVGVPDTADPGAYFYGINKTTGASFTPTAANWAYRFRLRTS